MSHDFKTHPELTNTQMQFYYFISPHKQITQGFRAKVIKVVDGDTIRVTSDFRNFDFPVRFLETNAPEMNEPRGHEVREWLEGLLLGEEVYILVNPRQRVGKWGRLLGTIFHRGLNINEESIRSGRATTFLNRDEGKVPALERVMAAWS